jgi:hypothetical protein
MAIEAFRQQTAALIVGEAMAPATELSRKNAIFLAQIFDCMLLLLILPTSTQSSNPLRGGRTTPPGPPARVISQSTSATAITGLRNRTLRSLPVRWLSLNPKPVNRGRVHVFYRPSSARVLSAELVKSASPANSAAN